MHAKQLVDGRDRRQLERLCKYITRPPIAQERLEQRADGRLVLRLKNVWKGGTRALVFEPHDLLTRLVAAVAPPKFHLLRYFGVLSGHVWLRSEIVSSPPADDSIGPPPRQLDLFETSEEVRLVRKPWAALEACLARGPLGLPQLRRPTDIFCAFLVSRRDVI